MLTRSARKPRGASAAAAATTTPTRMVDFHGRLEPRMDRREDPCGSRPSRAMASRIRGWLRLPTRSELVMPARMPERDQSRPRRSGPWIERPRPAAHSCRSGGKGTIPVSTAATATYRTVQIVSAPMMPIARSRCGRRASSAWVEIESNPM